MKQYIKDFKSFTINEQTFPPYDQTAVDKVEGVEYGKQYEVHDKNTGYLLGWFQVDDGGLFNDGSEQDDYPIFTPNKEAIDKGLIAINNPEISGAPGHKTFAFPENGVIAKGSEVGELALNPDTGFYEAPNIQTPTIAYDDGELAAGTGGGEDEIVSAE